MKIDSPIQKFFEQYPCKSERTKEFINLMMQGNPYWKIAELLGLKESYVQCRVSKFQIKHNIDRLFMMSKIYQIARDMDGLEKSDTETAYQYLLRPDSVD